MTSTIAEREESNSNTMVPSFVLPPAVQRVLEKLDSPHAACSTDFEYMEVIVAVESTRILAFNLRERITQNFFKVANEDAKWRMDLKRDGTCTTQTAGKPTTVSAKELVEYLEGLTNKLEQYREAQLALMLPQRKPIVEAFLDAMEANDEEKIVFRFILANATGLAGFSDINASSAKDVLGLYDYYDEGGGCGGDLQGLASVSVRSVTCRLLSDVLQIPILDILELANPKSIWIKEGILQDCKDQMSRSIVRQDLWKASPFLGMEMTVADFEGLGSEVLKNVLLHDPIFAETQTGNTLLKIKKAEEEGPPKGDALSSKKASSTNFDFMQAFEAAQAAASGGAGKRESVLEILSSARGEQQQQKQQIEAGGLKKKPSDEWTDVDPSDKSSDDKLEETDKEGEVENTDSMLEEFGPYKNDLNYLEDQVRIMEQARLLNKMKTDVMENKFKEDQELFRDKNAKRANHSMSYFGEPPEVVENPAQKEERKRTIQRLTQTAKKLQSRVETRILATLRETGRELRLEQLCKALGLSTFERYTILSLIKGIIVPPKENSYSVTAMGGVTKNPLFEDTVGDLIRDFCSTLQEKMLHRKYFYKSSTLIREGIISIKQPDFHKDLSHCVVELDRRLFDYLSALDTEFSELVDGSHLYEPTASLDDVVLPADTKQRVCDVVLNFDKLKKKIREYDVQDKISYGLGQVLLFHGASGTGKTYLANAIAAEANKKVLLINFPALPPNSSAAIIKMLFREAKINNALLFFDECESLFFTRDKGGCSINMVLTEIERFDGLCIMATNRPVDLDEALHRRVSLAVEFRKPDHIMREAIWKKLHPPKVPIEGSIDFGLLARKYELSGGMIKNCWLSALGIMVQKQTAAVTQEFLMKAAREQVIGQLSMEAFDRRVVPTHGIDALVVSDSVREALNGIVHSQKASAVLFGNWGFDSLHRSNLGVSALFTGNPGTGKTMAAEAVAFEVGSPLLVVNVAELVSKYVGETAKNIEGIFAEAKKNDAVLVFDEAEGLFGTRNGSGSGSSSRHDNMNVGILLHLMENFSGICIVITNLKEAIDDAFFRRFRFAVSFDEPGVAEREKIWKDMIPKACPVDSDVSFSTLASRYELKGGEIRQALMRAATKAALKSEENRIITMADLENACRQELQKKGNKTGAANMYM